METWGDIINIAVLFLVIFFGVWTTGSISHQPNPAKRAAKIAGIIILVLFVVVGALILIA